MHNPERKRPTAKEIFLRASELHSEGERGVYLDQACAGDVKLRDQLEAMVRENSRDGSNPLDRLGMLFGVAGAAHGSVTALAASRSDEGRMIGHYKLLEQIGQGGFGTVYMADQTTPVRRTVALKVLKPGMDTNEVIARFETERQALAMMDHPNIAKVLDAGTTAEGRPFFVMELVRGVPITDYCDEARLTNHERLRLFVDVCRAVQHAHQKGIIHRDLKPSNVLVTMHDDKAVAKVIDFGIAKAVSQPLTDRTLFTGYHQLLGTPRYMSPEQAQLSGLDVDTRSDVYSLGVLLYELLTGTTPFTKQSLGNLSYDELRRVLREQDPPRPSARITTLDALARSTVADRRRLDQRRISDALRGELDWIVMKALEKDRNRRYESASDFAADVERYLNNEAVQACPPTIVYRLRKLAMRHRTGIAATSIAVAALVTGLVFAVWHAFRADQERDRANRAAELLLTETRIANQQRQRAEAAELERRQVAERTEQILYAGAVRLASRNLQAGDDEHARQILEEWIPTEGRSDRRGFEWYLLHNQLQVSGEELMRLPGDVSCVRLSPDGAYLVAGTDGGKIQRFGFAAARPLASWETRLVDVRRMEFSSDGSLLAVISYEAQAVLIETATGLVKKRFPKPSAVIGQPDVALTEGKLVIFGSDRPVTIWDPRTESEQDWGLAARIRDACTVPKGAGLALLTSNQEEPVDRCHLIPALTRGHGEREIGLIFDPSTIAVSPNGKILAIGGDQGELMIGKVDSLTKDLVTLHQVTEKINEIAFSPDGTAVSAVDRTGVVHIWQADTGWDSSLRGSAFEYHHWQAHPRPARSVVFTPEGNSLITAGVDGRIMRWPVNRSSIRRIQIPDEHTQLALLPKIGAIASAGDHAIKVHDLKSTRILTELRLPSQQDAVSKTAASDSGDWLAVVTYANTILFSNMGEPAKLEELPQSFEGAETRLQLLQFLPSTHTLLAAGDASGLRLCAWNLESGQILFHQHLPMVSANQCAILGKSNRLAVLTANEVLILQPQTATIEQRYPFAGDDVSALASSPDGSLLAVGRKDRTIVLMESTTGQSRRVLRGHLGAIAKLRFTPDGRTLIASDHRKQVRFWHTQTGAELLSWSHKGTICDVDISSDGHILALAFEDSDTIEVLQAAPTLHSADKSTFNILRP